MNDRKSRVFRAAKILFQSITPDRLIAIAAVVISVWAIYEAKFAEKSRLRAIHYEITSDADWNIILLGNEENQRAPDKVFATPIYVTSDDRKSIKIGQKRLLQLPGRSLKDGRPKYRFENVDKMLCAYIENKDDCEKFGVERIRFDYEIGGVPKSSIVSGRSGV